MRQIQGRRWAVVGLAGAMLAAGLAGAISPARAANDSFYFTQTRHTVSGGFCAYWQSHGGLAQYGLPLTDEFQQQSAVDGKSYTMQYFERAVFEFHPDAPAGYRIMLSLLGSLRYHDRYEAISNPRPSQWAPAPGLAPTEAPVLLNATFAGADLSAWQPIPTLDEPATWQMLNGHLQQAGDVNGDTKDRETVLLAGSPAWRNIQLEAQLIATSGDPIGVVWRATNTSYYRLTLLPALPSAHWKAAIERVDKGKATTLVSAPPRSSRATISASGSRCGSWRRARGSRSSSTAWPCSTRKTAPWRKVRSASTRRRTA